ncbi:ABC transporter substrate-binding protein [Paenibacillus sp. PAMC21692]|uniref:ABC transporter substrate-binding protein n=1 Tax=Paenibacillus sp. PAMC21692 TaxID=2762320 RepID=UPI0037C5D594
MKNGMAGLMLLLTLSLAITACGGGNNGNNEPAGSPAATETATAEATVQPTEETATGTQVIKYLDQEYEIPANVERIVITGAVEAMEDSIVLDVKPVGAISFGGEFPALFQSITTDAVSVGEKTEPNFEQILSLKPDVILGSTKFPAEVTEKLATIAPTILYSHISTNWEANLKLLGQLSGKEAQAEEEVAKYKADLEAAKSQLGDKLKDQKVAVVRIRQGGKMFIYPTNVYFNPILYEELGLTAPDAVAAAKAQEEITTEQLAAINPDFLFLQFEPTENADAPKALEDLQNNPIAKTTEAFKNGNLFINVVDPLAQGGTAYSKIEFLKAAVAKLTP